MALFPGDSRYELILNVSVSGTVINAWSDVRKNAGGGFNTSDPQWYRIRISGFDSDGYWTYNFAGSTPKTIGVGSFSRNVGYGSFLVETWVNMDSGFGQAYEARWVTITNPATVPPAPTPIGLDMITPTGMRYRFSGNGDGGSGILRWEYQCSPDPAFPVPVGTSSGTTVRDDLQPGTVYYWRSRGVNAVGAGPWSSVISARTLARARVPKGGAYVPAAQVTVPKVGALVAAAAVKVPKAGVYVDAV